jgi:hypothetical protein
MSVLLGSVHVGIATYRLFTYSSCGGKVIPSHNYRSRDKNVLMINKSNP